MQSWIGVKARSTVPLNYDDWRHVDSKLKGKIWKDTYMHLGKFKSKTNISSNAIVFGKNGPEIWTFACPKQPYNYECGYYVLTYIRDMLQHSNPITAIKAKFGGLSQYFEDDHLLPLRQQWLNNV
ncbi:hypothetical protein G4B88_003283 [Cannabis sativa]|uniref:Ubiquitin-like protease family profile domain-containing protein n=1 Tax=Cannabis sativa TaxID=3483 RepID=A0A7J6I432_CANSA|nr:hypothetical protein G4B88_009129 [Cannabis sativa]KAF4402362.1 hypothetical protein G4B88_003283 [Cannabis sativa]